MITSTFILKKKTAASYDNRRTAMLSVFIFADGGAGVGIHSTVHSRVSGTGNRQPIPLSSNPNLTLLVPKR